MKSVFNVLKCTSIIIGTVIGAGFISGRELIRFFGSNNFPPAVYVAGLLFFFLLFFVLYCGNKFGGFAAMTEKIFKKASKAVYAVLMFGSLVIVAGMLSGIDALAFDLIEIPAAIPLFSTLSIVAAYFVSKKGIGGVGVLNMVLVPLMIAFIFCFLLVKKSFSYQFEETVSAFDSLGSVFLYVSMNVFLASPVLGDAGAKLKGCGQIALCALLSAVIIGASILLVLSSVCFEGANAISAEMPLLYVLSRSGTVWHGLFAAVSYFGIMTTLISSYYPLHNACKKFRKKELFRVLVIVLALTVSRLGFGEIVQFLYPLLGVCGLIYFGIGAARLGSGRVSDTDTAKEQSERVYKELIPIRRN